jgi:hypothetical protein
LTLSIYLQYTIKQISNKICKDLLSSDPDIYENPVVARILGNNELIQEDIFTKSKWKKIILKRNEIKDLKLLTIQVDRTWNPSLTGISTDSRDLGIIVAIPETR